MTEVKLSPSVAAVLRGVADGKVTRKFGLNIIRPDDDVWEWIPGATRKVNREMSKLQEAELATYRRAFGDLAATWQPTEAGVQWLAEHEEDA